nr:hypothetical protein [Tanacetum cinerariifolium]
MIMLLRLDASSDRTTKKKEIDVRILSATEIFGQDASSYMFDVEETFGRLTLYLDHLDMNLLEYLSQAITYDIDALAEIEVKTEGVEARTSTTEGVKARNSTTKDVEARTSTKEKEKEKVSEDASDVVETKRCTSEVESQTEYESNDDSDYQSDKSVDYLSPGEDELIKLRNRMKANRKAKAKAKDKPDEEMNEPNEENNMPADNVRAETFKEHDIYMNELLKSLKIVGKKYTSVAQFKECLTYYGLANGFYLWYERSGEERLLTEIAIKKEIGRGLETEYPGGPAVDFWDIILTLYLDHLDMTLSEYLSQTITYNMDACVYNKIGPPKKRYCNDFSVEEMVDWAEMEVETEGVEAKTSTTDGVEARNSTAQDVEARTSTRDKVKEKVSEDASDVVETRRCIVEVDTETEYESDDDSDYQSNKLVDYLSPGEDKLIKLRNMMKASRKAKAKAKDNPDEEMNEPNEENSMLANNVRGKTFKEHDIYMNDLLKSLKTADKYGITEDPFIFVKKTCREFKECLTYYALANDFSLWYERSGEVRVVAKCGQRPPRVSDPKKGKQKEQAKYPCASSDELPKCLWRCYARRMTDEKTFPCISLNDEHTCVRNFNFGALVNYKWIAKIFGDKIKANPNIRLCNIANLVMKRYKCQVSLNQCINAKKYALTEYEKSIDEHYSMLRSYGKAILDSNPGSTINLRVTVNSDGKTYFDRFYVCFVGLADGWKASYRKIIALDGCFLRSPNQSEILTAIGKDVNNHIYPMAWAVVDRGCEAMENCFSECFNIVIVNVRHKPLLTMLEAIGVIVLERVNKMREISRKWNLGTAEEKKTRKIDRLARSLLIQGLPNDIYSLIDSNETAKDLWDALERQMCGSEYGEQDRKAAILYEYETFKATEGE